ncbi:MAG: ATP-dependent helicase RecG [Actinomycetota bacterium]
MRTGARLRVVLHAEGSVPDDLHSFVGLIVQVSVRDFRDVTQRLRIDTEVVILARDFHSSRAQVAHRMVGTVMTEGQLEGLAAEREGQQLMTETDTEHGGPAFDERADGLRSTSDDLGIARTVREEDSVWRHREHFLCRRTRRYDPDGRDLREARQDRRLDAEVEGNHLESTRTDVIRLRCRHLCHQVDPARANLGASDGQQFIYPTSTEGPWHGAGVAQDSCQTSGVDPTDSLDAMRGEIRIEVVVASPVASPTRKLAHDHSTCVNFASLGVVVIDEQHRFGVEQRAALSAKGDDSSTPDVLVMTATPIPRTAAMTVYGDLDVSVLDELPPGRTPIVTKWAAGPLIEETMWAHVREVVAAGQQAYVVCPLIEESDKVEAASAEKIHAELSGDVLKGLKVGLLHGRMSSAEKDEVMGKFRAKKLDVLVATTVIEVGVDVPNATVMVVLDADRFGIAQLHQLRGRVGRGSIASTCWLQTKDADEHSPRVDALVGTTDGFELAEIDLELRGEGTLMNTAQKGRSDLKLASLRRDRDLIDMAREAAFAIIDEDPTLKKHKVLRDEIELLLTPEEEEFLFKS